MHALCSKQSHLLPPLGPPEGSLPLGKELGFDRQDHLATFQTISCISQCPTIHPVFQVLVCIPLSSESSHPCWRQAKGDCSRGAQELEEGCCRGRGWFNERGHALQGPLLLPGEMEKCPVATGRGKRCDGLRTAWCHPGNQGFISTTTAGLLKPHLGGQTQNDCIKTLIKGHRVPGKTAMNNVVIEYLLYICMRGVCVRWKASLPMYTLTSAALRICF